jgi:hypothetical protein
MDARDAISRRALLLTAAASGVWPAYARAETVPTLGFGELYKSFGVLGLEFSDKLTSLKGRDVSMRGYMAPPLKPESDFFVLTREPLAICPFCQSDADWPLDIVVIYLKGAVPLAPAGSRLTVTGRLEVGSWTDPATGFVSQVRVVSAGVSA